MRTPDLLERRYIKKLSLMLTNSTPSLKELLDQKSKLCNDLFALVHDSNYVMDRLRIQLVCENLQRCCNFNGPAILTNSGALRFSKQLCRQRICPLCTSARQRNYQATMLYGMRKLRELGLRLYHVTLTLQHFRNDEVGVLHRRLRGCFEKLTARKWFKTVVHSWARFLEVTYSDFTGYNPHYHLILSSKVEPAVLEDALRTLWTDLTTKVHRRSHVVHVREIRDESTDERNSAAYPGKASSTRFEKSNPIVIHQSRPRASIIWQIEKTLHGVRAFSTSRNWPRVRVETAEEDKHELRITFDEQLRLLREIQTPEDRQAFRALTHEYELAIEDGRVQHWSPLSAEVERIQLIGDAISEEVKLVRLE